MAISLRTFQGGEIALNEAALAQFRSGIRGDVLTPDDSRYGERPIFNAMHNRRPALIVRCTGTADVVDTVRFAREHNALVAVRGGGHSVAGHSSCDGGIVIDLTRMRAVDVDAENRVARIQGGALWGDVDRETQAFGLAVPGGVVSETGVAGLTLGGGEGWIRRKYGLTIDSLLSARVVCADGSVVTASATSHPDLFWALRGGGGNFGVVTSFEFRAHALGPIVAFAGVFYRVADAAAVLRGWREYCADAPDEVTSVALAITMPADPHLPPPIHGQACLVVGGVYAGSPDEGMRIMQPLRQLGTPLADISQPMPFAAVNSAFDPFFPMGKLHSYWKAQNLRCVARHGNRHHRRAREEPALAADARRHVPDGGRDQPGRTVRDGLRRAVGAMDVVGGRQLGESGGRRRQRRVGPRELRAHLGVLLRDHLHELHGAGR